MKTKSTAQAIRERIAALPEAEPFTTALFTDLGSRANIHQVLARLVQGGTIDRVAHGIYVPAMGTKFGLKLKPSVDKIVRAIANAEGATIQIHGATTANRFGLTTQVPVWPIYYTSGTARKIRTGKQIIRMRHASPRKLALAGRPAGDALVGLWHIGNGWVTSDMLRKVQALLPEEEFKVLSQAKAVMPAWLAGAFARYEREAVADAGPTAEGS